MLYINDRNQPHFTYDEIVDKAIQAGVDPKRAYIFLAALGVRGASARIMGDSGLGYLPAVKVAVKHGKLVTGVTVCDSCGSFKVY